MSQAGGEIYFFSGGSAVSRMAVSLLRTLRPDAPIRELVIDSAAKKQAFEAEPHRPRTIISFLNPFILPAELLRSCEGRSFNIHPASPDFPGRDPQHFAFYEGVTQAAATLHRMLPSVDSGEILDVAVAGFDRQRGVQAYVEECSFLGLGLLVRHLDALLDGRDFQPVGRWTWRAGAKRSRRDFLDACLVGPDVSPEELTRRIEAFHVDGFRNLRTQLHGRDFYYAPKAS